MDTHLGGEANNLYLAGMYRLHAVAFWEAAMALSEKLEVDSEGVPTKITALPLYFLASHAAELLLKACLLKRGLSQDVLMKLDYRHSLAGLLQLLLDKGISVTPATADIVRGLHEQHQTHALRYTALVDDGRPIYVPPTSIVFSALDELLMLTRVR